jgi:hypothetical protein
MYKNNSSNKNKKKGINIGRKNEEGRENRHREKG